MARVDRDFRARLDHLNNFVHIREIQARTDTLRIQIHGQYDQIHIPTSLAIGAICALVWGFSFIVYEKGV